MKCPYNINIEQANQDVYEYEDGLTKFHENKLVEYRQFTDCLKDECGAWQNGRCQYRGE